MGSRSGSKVRPGTRPVKRECLPSLASTGIRGHLGNPRARDQAREGPSPVEDLMTRPSGAIAPPDRKPRDDEIDIFGITHPGKVRKDNQDQFLVCALRKEAVVQL